MTEAELIAALHEALAKGTLEGSTAGEIAARMECGINKARFAIKILLGRGTLCADRGWRIAMDGRPTSVPVYRSP